MVSGAQHRAVYDILDAWCARLQMVIGLGGPRHSGRIWLLARPIAGPLTLTAALILFFLIEGICSVMFAIDHRRELSGQWEFMLLSGLVDLVRA